MIRMLFLASSLLLISCSQSLKDYKNSKPELDLAKFFQGSLSAHGIVQDYKGQVIRTFSAELVATWRGNKGLLDEKFYFNDGKVEYRCWQLSKNGNSYSGTAGDVVGTAKGEVFGNTLNWQYDLMVETDSGPRQLRLDDWLYMIDDNTIINRTAMSFYGIDVAEVTLSISKEPNENYTTRENCTFR